MSRCDAVFHHSGDFGLIEHRIAIQPLPLFGPLGGVADFLRVQIRATLLNLLQIQAHVDEHALRDDGRQKAIQRLLGAAVGIIDQVWQGIDHGAGQRRRVANFEPRLFDASFGRHTEADFAHAVVRPQRTGKTLGLEHAVDVDRKRLLDGVRFFVRQGFHADDGLPFRGDFHAPIDAHLAAAGHFDLPREIVKRGKAFPIQFQSHGHLLGGFQIIVDIGRQHDFVFLDKEPRGLLTDDQIFSRDDIGIALTDVRAVAHAPDAHFPGGEILWHGERDFRGAVFIGGERAGPQRGVGEVGAHGRLDQRGFAIVGHRQCFARARAALAPNCGGAAGAGVCIIPFRIAPPKPPPPIPPAAPPRSCIVCVPSKIPSSTTVPPKIPKSSMPCCFGGTRLPNIRIRLVSCWAKCERRHFQKNALMSSTLLPPEMYSTALS